MKATARRHTIAAHLTAWSNRSLIGSLAFVGLAGLAYCISLGSQVRFADEADYLRLSQSVADTGRYALDGVNSTAFRPPGYPYLLALLRQFSDSVPVLRSVNIIFLAVAVWATWWLARRIGGPGAAALAAPIAAVYPIGFYTMGTLYPQAMGTALLLTGLVAIVALPESAHPYRLAIGAGAVFGLLIVTIPTFAVVLLIGVLWLARRHQRLLVLAVIIGVAAIVPAGWMTRNAIVMHSVIPISTNNGLNLLLGNSEHAGPRTGVNADISAYIDEGQQRQLNEMDLDAYYRKSAVTWATVNPARAATLFVEKTANYFAPFDRLGTDAQSSTSQQAVAVITYLPLLALFVLRLARWRRDRPGEVERLLILIYLVSAPVQALFFTRVRFRAPLDPLLIVIAAAMVARWLVVTDAPDARVEGRGDAETADIPG